MKHLAKQFGEHVEKDREVFSTSGARFFANYYRGDINDVMLFRARIHGGDKK